MNQVVSAKDVIQALTFTCKMSGLDLDDTEKQFYLKKLKGRMTGDEIVSALDDLCEKGKKPTLAAILEFEKGGFDSAAVAYSKAVSMLTDETQTCLMNDCITQAWSLAQPLYEEGMKYDASRVFEEHYNEMVRDSKAAGMVRPKWWLSPGTNKAQREEFIRDAIASGLLPNSAVQANLPHLTKEEVATQITLPNPSFKSLANAAVNAKTPAEKQFAKEAMAGLFEMIGKSTKEKIA